MASVPDSQMPTDSLRRDSCPLQLECTSITFPEVLKGGDIWRVAPINPLPPVLVPHYLISPVPLPCNGKDPTWGTSQAK